MHAGDEYATDPNETQRMFARAAIDAGALLVVGHHPHVLQPFERYNGGLILYSLGNFVFDQVIPETQQSVIARIVFTENDIEDVSFIPVSINDLSRPVVVSNEEGKSIIERIVGTTE
jgi:poly-gamma-glutamate synthesis protein (capsule biosynthesis protein)